MASVELHEQSNITTQSALKLFMNCPMRYFYRYRLYLVPRLININLAIGSAVHAGIEAALYEIKEHGKKDFGIELDDLIAVAVEAVDTTFENYFNNPIIDCTNIKDTLTSTGVAEACIRGWLHNISYYGNPYTDILEIEKTIIRNFPSLDSKRNLRPDRKIAGCIDLIYLSAINKISIGEHKTRSTMPYWGTLNSLACDWQLLFYMLLMEAYLNENNFKEDICTSATYNCIKKPLHRTPKKYEELLKKRIDAMWEHPEQYFLIQSVHIPMRLQTQFKSNLERILDLLYQCAGVTNYYSNLTACEVQGNYCPYRRLCEMGCTVANYKKACNAADWEEHYYIDIPNKELNQSEIETL